MPQQEKLRDDDEEDQRNHRKDGQDFFVPLCHVFPPNAKRSPDFSGDRGFETTTLEVARRPLNRSFGHTPPLPGQGPRSDISDALMIGVTKASMTVDANR
jgi:hypothetical protein